MKLGGKGERVCADGNWVPSFQYCSLSLRSPKRSDNAMHLSIFFDEATFANCLFLELAMRIVSSVNGKGLPSRMSRLPTMICACGQLFQVLRRISRIIAVFVSKIGRREVGVHPLFLVMFPPSFSSQRYSALCQRTQVVVVLWGPQQPSGQHSGWAVKRP